MRPRPAARNVPAVKITSTTLIRLFRFAGPIVACVVGLIFMVVGVGLVVSQGWEKATGTATSCESRRVTTGTSSSRHTETSCQVAWRDAAGNDHSGTVDFGAQTVVVGETIELRVNGDSAVEAVPGWWAWGSLILGVALAGGGGIWLWRTLRPTAR
jgi:Protein of unknown function (DUF3592)